jgi:hypothetical protein
MKKVLPVLGISFLTLVLGFFGYVAWFLYPHDNPQALPPTLIAVDSVEGALRLQRADFRTDYPILSKSYQSQMLASFCGVASSVAILQALGKDASQWGFFTEEASKVRSRSKVIFGGMSLEELAGLLATHGLNTSIHYADQFSLEEFRASIEHNLANKEDYLLVNYQREKLGQDSVGHISPLAAYDSASDSVLIMDTASYKYPPTWVPVSLLYSDLKTRDSSSGRVRGYLEVSR